MSIITLLCFASGVVAQKQLILLRKQEVLLRLNPGDEFVYKRKHSRIIKRTYVNNLSDTAVVTHRDTIPFREIDKIYFQQTTRLNVFGTALVIGGGALFLIDQLNYSVIQGNDASLDRGISVSSLAAIGVGLPMMLLKKKSQKIRLPYRVRMATAESPFYWAEPKGYQIPMGN